MPEYSGICPEAASGTPAGVSYWEIWAWLWASRWFKSFSWGVRDEDVVYDIEAVDLDDA